MGNENRTKLGQRPATPPPPQQMPEDPKGFCLFMISNIGKQLELVRQDAEKQIGDLKARRDLAITALTKQKNIMLKILRRLKDDD